MRIGTRSEGNRLKKWKSLLLRLERKVSALKNPVPSQRDLVVEQVIVVFAVIVWLAAMMLLP